MMDQNDGGPAFPQHDLSGYGFGPTSRGITTDESGEITGGRYTTEGMALRDWFAGQALTAVTMYETQTPEEAARHAYAVADAMLAERERGE